MIDDSREKLINMMIFFLEKTKYCGKTKLFKLLSFSDFLHFKKTGKSISGLEYFAWDMGPVPKQLFEEFKNPPKDLSECFYIPTKGELEQDQWDFTIKGKKRFYDGCFTPRELSILKRMAFIYKEAKSKDMVEASHLKNQPWHTTYHKNGRFKKIDYFLALDETKESLPKHIVQERIEDIKEMKKFLVLLNNPINNDPYVFCRTTTQQKTKH